MKVNQVKCRFLRRGETGVPGENLSVQSRETQTQPTYDGESGNRTRATLVGGKCSHHCAIPAPLILSLQSVALIQTGLNSWGDSDFQKINRGTRGELFATTCPGDVSQRLIAWCVPAFNAGEAQSILAVKWHAVLRPLFQNSTKKSISS